MKKFKKLLELARNFNRRLWIISPGALSNIACQSRKSLPEKQQQMKLPEIVFAADLQLNLPVITCTAGEPHGTEIPAGCRETYLFMYIYFRRFLMCIVSGPQRTRFCPGI